MTQRRVEKTRVHFWTFLPVSVKILSLVDNSEMDIYMNMQITTTEDDEEMENLSDEESDSDDCLERFNFSNLCYNYF